MNARSLDNLQKTLSPHVPLGTSGLKKLCIVSLGMIGARTVKLGRDFR